MPVISAASIYMAPAISQGSEIDDLIAQNKDIAEANASLDRTYQKIIATLDGQVAAGDSSAKNLKTALME